MNISGRMRMASLLLALLIMPLPAGAAGTIKLPETGRTASMIPGDDGDLRTGVSWPNPRFTVGAGAGADCVADNLTGLMWMRDPTPLSASSLSWAGALSYANGLVLCGYDDWRLPSINELKSLANAGNNCTYCWLRAQGFGRDLNTDFWSSTTYMDYPQWAWYMDLNGNGNPAWEYKVGGLHYAWPVRGISTGPARVPRTGQQLCYDPAGAGIDCAGTGQDGELRPGAVWPGPRFTAGTGTAADCITDNLTGLTWSVNTSPSWSGWGGSVGFANNLALCGYTDWRLPNRVELDSLLNQGRASSASWLYDWGFRDLMGYGYYWTSTPIGASWAWALSLNDDKFYYLQTSSSDWAWPVRGGVTKRTTVITPDGGEAYFSGTPHTVWWDAPPETDHVKILYSLNNGRNWFTLADSLTGRSYPWFLPLVARDRNNCLVKVVAYNAAGIKIGSDRSDAPFKILVIFP